MKRLVLLILAVAFLGTVTGCETVKGIGKDIENTGENIWGAVNK